MRQLVDTAGVPAADITLYDAIRNIPDVIYGPCKAEFPGLRFIEWEGGDGRLQPQRDLDTRVRWSETLDLNEEGGVNPTYLPACVTQAAYVINLAGMKGHIMAGVTFCAKNHLGSLLADVSGGFSGQLTPKGAGIHPYIAVHATNIGKGWTSSLFLSQDQVALESVLLDFCRMEQEAASGAMTEIYGTVDNYLHEAAQANDPPSGTTYDPEGDGVPLPSLGVHEHWDSPQTRQYSRNLGTGQGIELVSLKPGDVYVSRPLAGQAFTLAVEAGRNRHLVFEAGTRVSYDGAGLTGGSYTATLRQGDEMLSGGFQIRR